MQDSSDAAAKTDTHATPTAAGIEGWIAANWPTILAYGVRVLGVLIFLIVAWVLASWIRRVARQGFKQAGLDPTIGNFLSNVIRWAILLLAMLACIQAFGIPMTSFAAVIGAAGLTIALAFQGSLSNLSSGILLLIFRPFKMGDFVVIAGQMGTVDEIDLFQTTLDTPENKRVIIPNGQIFNSVIENISHHPRRRIDLTINVSLEADIEVTRRVLDSALRTVPGLLSDPAAEAVLMDLTHSGVSWQIRAWATREDFGKVRQDVIRAAKQALDAAGIEVPFQHVHIRMSGANPAQSPH